MAVALTGYLSEYSTVWCSKSVEGSLLTIAEMVPKETFELIEMVLQAQNDEELARFYHDFHIEDTDPLDIYSKAEFCTNYMDEIYGVKEEFNTLLYHLDMNDDMDILNPTDVFEDTLQDTIQVSQYLHVVLTSHK